MSRLLSRRGLLIRLAVVLATGAFIFTHDGDRQYVLVQEPVREIVKPVEAALGVALACTAHLEKRALNIEFTVTNRSDETIFLLDQCTNRPKAGLVCDAGNDTISIVVGFPSLPRGYLPISHPLPCSSALEAADSKSSTISISVPLREKSPAAHFLVLSSLPVEAQSHTCPDDPECLTELYFGVNVRIDRLRLRLDFLRSSAPGFNTDYGHPDGPTENAQCEIVLRTPMLLERIGGPSERNFVRE